MAVLHRGSTAATAAGASGKKRRRGPQRDVNEGDQHRNFDQGADDAGQRLPGGHPESADRHRDGQFEVVAGRGERQRGGALVAQSSRVSTTCRRRTSARSRPAAAARSGPRPAGREVMSSPCSANSSTMVNSRPYSAHGPSFGRNLPSYHSRPLALSPSVRVRNPASSGMPRKTSTDAAIAQTENSALVVGRPSQPGSSCR